MGAEQKCHLCGDPEAPRDSCTIAPGKWICRNCFNKLNEGQLQDLMRQAVGQTKIVVTAGEKCSHCGDSTPLGGVCPCCGGKICTRSMRVRQMALDGMISIRWACPAAEPIAAASRASRHHNPGITNRKVKTESTQ